MRSSSKSSLLKRMGMVFAASSLLWPTPRAQALLAEGAEAPKHDAPPAKQESAPSSQEHGSASAPQAKSTADIPFVDLPKDVERKCPGFSNGQPCPRRVQAPQISEETFEPLGTPAEASWDYRKFRYSMVLLVSSWNKRSTELAHITKRHFPKFVKRHIGIIALASHDSATELLQWKNENAIPFPVGLAKLPFTKAHGNPKVPTAWIANGRGELVTMVELPTDKEFQSLMDNLLLWTDF